MNLYEVMPRLLNMSLTAGIVILFVLAARLLLRNAPRGYLCALWLVPLFRLLCPVSFSAPFSLLSMLGAPVVDNRIEYIPPTIVHDAVPQVSLPVRAVSDAVNAALPQGAEQLAADPLEAFASFGALFWLAGACALLVWGLLSVLRLHFRLKSAVRSDGNVWHAEIPTAFVWGVLRPRIYLPFGLSETEEALVLQHEQAHIRRGDHILRVLLYLALCLHWFNPLVWVMFVLCGRDMELACDAYVLEHAQEDVRVDYAQALLHQAGGRALPFSPLSFGAGDVKKRIQSILRFTGSRSRLAGAALLAVATLGACLLVNPTGERELDTAASQQYGVDRFTYIMPNSTVELHDTFGLAISEDRELYFHNEDGWTYSGTFDEITFSDDELREAFRGDEIDPAQWETGDEEAFISSVTRAWQCRWETTSPSVYQKDLEGAAPETQTVDVPVMAVYTLFECADGSLHLAASGLGDWDAAAELHASFFGDDSIELLGERPESGWMGDARLPTVIYMMRLTPEHWEPQEMAELEGRRLLTAEEREIPEDWRWYWVGSFYDSCKLYAFRSESAELWGVVQLRKEDGTWSVHSSECWETERDDSLMRTANVRSVKIPKSDSQIWKSEETLVFALIEMKCDGTLQYSSRTGDPVMQEVKTGEPHVLLLNSVSDDFYGVACYNVTMFFTEGNQKSFQFQLMIEE